VHRKAQRTGTEDPDHRHLGSNPAEGTPKKAATSLGQIFLSSNISSSFGSFEKFLDSKKLSVSNEPERLLHIPFFSPEHLLTGAAVRTKGRSKRHLHQLIIHLSDRSIDTD
jgi:hypothetical protein